MAVETVREVFAALLCFAPSSVNVLQVVPDRQIAQLQL